MRDVDQDSEYGSDDNDPAAIGGVVDWLGRPYYDGHWKDKVCHIDPKIEETNMLTHRQVREIEAATRDEQLETARNASRQALHDAPPLLVYFEALLRSLASTEHN